MKKNNKKENEVAKIEIKKLFTEIPVVFNNGDLLSCEESYMDIYSSGNPEYPLPIIKQTEVDMISAYDAIPAISSSVKDNYYDQIDPKTVNMINQATNDIARCIDDGMAYSVSNELLNLIFQAKRSAVMKVYGYIQSNLKDIIDYKKLVSINIQDHISFPHDIYYSNLEYVLKRSINGIDSCSFSYVDGTKENYTDAQSDLIKSIYQIDDIVRFGMVMADREAQKLYYSISNIIGLITIPDMISNEQIVSIMADIDSTGVFHEYRDSILDIISFIMERASQVGNAIDCIRANPYDPYE